MTWGEWVVYAYQNNSALENVFGIIVVLLAAVVAGLFLAGVLFLVCGLGVCLYQVVRRQERSPSLGGVPPPEESLRPEIVATLPVEDKPKSRFELV